MAAMGRRTFRRSLYQAGLGRIRPTLAYKCAWAGRELAVADRWFASSKSHWYGRVTEAEVPTLVEQHLVGGEPVELLRIGPEDFCS